jgi:hypothetical protein
VSSRLALVAAAALATGACASSPEVYTRTPDYYVKREIEIPNDGPQIERGEPNVVIDGLNDYLLSLPVKLLLLDRQALDHKLTPEGEELLSRYLEMNQLRSVKIRHNQYAPIDEFRRLTENEEVGAGYRYTLGLVSWLVYTLIPDRLFAGVPMIGGGDHFNPFTNTVNVYSSDPTILLHEAGHAKDYTQHEWKGTSFALIRLLPGVDLIQEATASQDAIQFLWCIHDKENEVRAYKTLIPAYSTYIAGYIPGGLWVTLPVVAAGHVTGRVQASRREDAPPPQVDLRPPFCVPTPKGDAVPSP